MTRFVPSCSLTEVFVGMISVFIVILTFLWLPLLIKIDVDYLCCLGQAIFAHLSSKKFYLQRDSVLNKSKTLVTVADVFFLIYRDHLLQISNCFDQQQVLI